MNSDVYYSATLLSFHSVIKINNLGVNRLQSANDYYYKTHARENKFLLS